jgi:hypothetical protein
MPRSATSVAASGTAGGRGSAAYVGLIVMMRRAAGMRIATAERIRVVTKPGVDAALTLRRPVMSERRRGRAQKKQSPDFATKSGLLKPIGAAQGRKL